jgi:hypothetical protein
MMTDRISLRMRLAAALALVWCAACGQRPPAAITTGADAGARAYPTADEAVAAFVEATRSGSVPDLLTILGPGSEDIISSGDTVADRAERTRFLARYDSAHTLVDTGPDQLTLEVGPDAWPLPIPLAKADGKWHWDGAAGRQEIVFRRIGHNELGAIAVCRGAVGAQQEYAATPHDGRPAGSYATRIVSQPGRQDGLYWPAAAGEAESPAGPLLAQAGSEGYDTTGARTPYHGYYYRIVENPGGYGVVAYPADYRASGVMTFQVDQEGVVYQKDLGEATDSVAQALAAYAIDSTWSVTASGD